MAKNPKNITKKSENKTKHLANTENYEEFEDLTEDPFAEYLRHGPPSQRTLADAWQTAIGLQAVDGLTPSQYLLDTARRTIEGEITLDNAQQLIDSYYHDNPNLAVDRVDEADKVATRIAQLLSEQGFVFSTAQYLAIHRRLFDGIYSHAGKISTYNISKKEWVLGGDTVTYGNAADLLATLEYDLSTEQSFSYQGLDTGQTIEHLANFVARLWQIHVFGEGNTRTTAVFFIKYLRSLGFIVDNAPFARHAWYFRNAMVRANYEKLSKDIYETTEYLVNFLRNVLLGEENDLHNRYMHISGLIVPPENQDIRRKIRTFSSKNQDIHFPSLAPVSARHAERLYAKFGDDGVFSRADVVTLLNVTASPASDLQRKLLDAHAISPVSGKGKGKYRFTLHAISSKADHDSSPKQSEW